MKAAAWIVAGLIIGFLLGGLGPRRELAAQQSKMADLEKRVQLAESKAARRGSERFFGLPALPEIPMKPRPTAAGSPVAGESAEPSPSGTPFDKMEAFQLAMDAQHLRAKQSRLALIEAAKLDRKQQEKVDDVIAKMNADLAKHAAELASLMNSMSDGGEPDPLELLTITKDVSGILLESQTAFQEATGNPDGVEPSASEVWNYIDLNIFKDVVQNLPPEIGPH